MDNLTIACVNCNQRKGNRTAAEFGHPQIQERVKATLKDAGKMNASRYALRDMLRGFGLPVETGTGGRTKFNRTRVGLDKFHWTDAACVGASTPERLRILESVPVEEIYARKRGERGRRQVCYVDKNGFPRHAYGKPQNAKRQVRSFGYQTGDIVKVAKVGKRGKHKGATAIAIGRLLVKDKATGTFKLENHRKGDGPPDLPVKTFRHHEIVRLVERDGRYEYGRRVDAPKAGVNAETEPKGVAQC